jgi:sugar fermentation stimulation protein A
MKYEPILQRGILVKRYKRFLADVMLDNGEQVTIHCPNTGSMKNCMTSGSPVWFSRSSNLARKYPFTWELLETSEGHWIGINTHQANHLVVEALRDKKLQAFKSFSSIKTEQKYGEENSRIDVLLENSAGLKVFMEIKSVTLLEDANHPDIEACGYFPDAVSDRAARHVRELMRLVKQGHRAVLFFCVQHTGIHKVKVASHVDARYAELVADALQQGVEVMAYQCCMSSEEIFLSHEIPFEHQ